MAWLSRVNFIASDTLSFTDVNNLGNDIRAWGDNVNGGGYTLSNVAISASSALAPVVLGGTGTTSTLTLRATSGVGTTGADIVFQTGNNGATEVMRMQNGGNVGVGKTPGVKFDVEGPLRSTSGSIDIRVQAGVSGAAGVGTFSADPLLLVVNGSERARITASGSVGIGTAGPAYQLQLSTDSAAKPSTNTWTIASDERLKTVLGNYEKGLDAICALRPVRYEYNGLGGMVADGKEHISIVAQEAREAFPECIGTVQGKLHEDDEEDTELLNYNGHAVTFALINAIKELKARLDALV
jgi:hypothetical protein